MSLATLEAPFGPVTSIFLVPLINIIFLSLIAHFISGGINFNGNQIQGISDRSYNSSLPVKFSDFSITETRPDVDFIKTRTGVFLRRTCIRFAMLEKASA
jgi:hypothetical protein